jgi:hypothetical protein
MSQLTISQSLRRIKRVKGKIAEYKTRAVQSVSHVKDKKPTFDFKAVREQLAAAKEELIGLESAVAVANAARTVTFEGREMRLAEAIRRLQELKDEMSWLPQLNLREGVERTSEFEWDESKGVQVRVVREITHVSHLSEVERVAELDMLRDRFEALNGLVESANHTTTVEWSDTKESTPA